MKNMQKVNRVILVLIIIISALFITKRLVTHKERPKRLTHVSKGAVVDVMTVQSTSLPLQVRGTGVVTPLLVAQVAPQVSGTVVYTSPRLLQAGFFKEGDILFKIEDTDSILALEQAKAELTKVKLELAQVEGQADIAMQEWQLLNVGAGDPHPLVIYKPQLASAKAMVTSAEAKVTLATLDVERTTVRAPFNCFIREKNVDVGQYVRDGNVVLNLVGTDQAEIIVPLPLADIAVVSGARKTGDSAVSVPGSEVTVRFDMGGVSHEWCGYVDRFAGEVDSTSRMLDVFVLVDDPYGLRDQTGQTMPLAVGSFVAVTIAGQKHDNVVKIPRIALHEQSTVWLARDDSTLAIQPVTVLRKNQDNVIIDSGLANGDRVIITPLRGASPGMKLRVSEQVGNGGAPR